MPKLKSHSFYCRTKSGKGLTFTVQISVGMDGTFYYPTEQIPERVRKVLVDELDREQIRASTLSGLVGRTEEIITKYEELIRDEQREKVILYTIAIQGDLTPSLSGSDEESRQHNDLRDSRNAVDLGFGVKWYVAWRFRMLGSVRYARWHVGDEAGTEFSKDRGEKEMPWTAEREQWFERLDASLIEMIKRVDDFLSAPGPTGLIQLIDSGQAMLPAPRGDSDDKPS